MSPYYAEVAVRQGVAFLLTFDRKPDGFYLKVEKDGKGVSETGPWQDVGDPGIEGVLHSLVPHPFERYRAAGQPMFVARERGSSEWSILVGHGPGDTFEDTGFRFTSEEEARRAIGR